MSIERRTEPRMLCADLVDVRWKDETGRSRRAVANLEDISHSGACLQLEDNIPLQTPVRISYPSGEFSGVVRYCQFKEIGFFIGIEFQGAQKWSIRNFKPLHFLDPRSLTKRAPVAVLKPRFSKPN
jgi:hypothetical protein